MSLKAELETWAAALKAYDDQDFDKSLQLFASIADSSKILTNMGLIYATLGEHDAAVEQFTAATQLDQYLAVAYFQCGVSNFLLGRFELALHDFDDALLYLRGNGDINYEQLGLKFKLYSAEVLFNKGLSLIYLGQLDDGLRELQDAKREKATEEHNVIDDAITDSGEGYTVFSIPVGVLYRPAEKKLQNAKTKDYMGKAKLVAAADASDAYTEFTGVARMRQGISPTGAADFGPGSLARSATVANPAPPPKNDDERPVPLQRAKTTINVVPRANATSPASSPVRSPSRAGRSLGLARSATSAGRMPPPMGAAGPTRGLSIRKPSPAVSPVATPAPAATSVRTTEFLDSYIDSYTDDPLPPLPAPQPTRAGTLRRTGTTSAAAGNARARSQQAPQSVYSNGSGGSVRRRPTRRPTVRATSTRAASTYEDDDEGYESGEFDEGPMELMKIRVKLHYQDDVRGMAFTPDMPWDEFLERVTSKFGRTSDGLGMKFKDEDDGKVSLRDEMDYELAIETARESAKGKPEGRLEIWCVDE